MTKGQIAALCCLICITFAVIKFLYFPNAKVLPDFGTGTKIDNVQIHEIPEEYDSQEQSQSEEKEDELPKMYVSIYFIGQNKNNDEVYKIVKRLYNPDIDGSKLEFSIRKLLAGPSIIEKKAGIYSEIPKGTKLISVTEQENKVVIDLSSDFEQGGGTDGLYKRLYQLIKTSNRNTNKNVYLKINGVTAEVIGGEGIMISQPLNADSLGE